MHLVTCWDIQKKNYYQWNFEEYTHPEDLEDNLRHLQLLREGEIDYFEMEKRYIRKDGEIVWGHLYASIVRNSSDEPLYILTKIEDITQRRKCRRQYKPVKRNIELSMKP